MLMLQICGSMHANLRAALKSARRLRDGPVHPDTLDHWAQIVVAARRDGTAMASFKTRELVGDLEQVIAARTTGRN